MPHWSGHIAVPGGSLYAEIDGSGPAVCLVHAGVANLRMWDPQVPALAEHHTVIRYDTRGFGRTESEAVEFSNREDLVAVLDHVGAERAVLVGASRGGIIALDTTLEFPDRVSGFVSVAGGISGYDPGIFTPEMAMWDEVEARWKAKEWEWLADFETAYWYDGPGQPTDRIEPALRALGHGWILDNYRAEKPEPTPRPLQPPAAARLAELQVPVLVMIGLRDDPGTVASGRFLAESTGGPLLEFDTAHMINLEQPERFLAALQEFLART
ncbi:MAG TPA: alpha/beta fold hydrolase [Acidimicrobiia bacterium]|nr:alpha/beta fold hydrolase [Acidimicrobiia bacterium]